MKDDRDESSFPERLAEGQGAASEILRRFVRQGWPPPPEAAAWERTVVRLVRGSRGSRVKMGLAVLAGACAMGLVVVLLGWPRPAAETAHAPSADRPAHALADAVSPDAVSAGPGALARLTATETAQEQLLSLRGGPVRLPDGASRLDHRSRITLSRGGEAHAATVAHGLTLVLEEGELGLDEREVRPHDVPVVVVAAPYRLVVLGAAFRVTRTHSHVVVTVDAGQLRIERNGAAVATVKAGRQWTGVVSTAKADAAGEVGAKDAWSSPGTLSQEGTAAPSSEGLSSGASSCSPEGAPSELLRCLLGVARGQTLSSEVALYQAAQLYRTSLHDPQGALSALRELRTRFPAGALRAEVSVSLAELLPQVGRYQDALAESETALRLAATPRRTAEVHLLRARILGVGLHDCVRAQDEYQAAAHGGSPPIRSESQAELARCTRSGKDLAP